MDKSVLCFLTVVIVSALWLIPVVSKTSGIAVAHSTQADEHDKHQNTRAGDEALNGERTFAIESFIPSVKIADESLTRTNREANMMDVPQVEETNKPLAIHKVDMMGVAQLKERNKVLATQMEKLEIDIGGLVYVAMAVQPHFKQFSLNNLEWMILGKIYFEKAESYTGYESSTMKELFHAMNIEIVDDKEISIWARKLNRFNVGADTVCSKMLWLIRHEGLNLHLADAAKMAFGSEYIPKRRLPIIDELIQALTVDKDVTEGVMEGSWKVNDEEPKYMREPFPIESLISSVKITDEALPRTNRAANMMDVPQAEETNKPLAISKVDMMDVSQLKEHNKVLATQMEKLGIDIGGVVYVALTLQLHFKQFSLNNLEWMILGKIYFEKAKSSTGYERLTTRELLNAMNIEITDDKGIDKWAGRFHGFHVRPKNVCGKMLWLIRHEGLNVHLADAAKMAFGSEYIPKRRLPIIDELIQALTVDKDVTEGVTEGSWKVNDEEPKYMREPFPIESFTSSIEITDESLFRTNRAAHMMDVSQVKELNKALATRLENFNINIDGVVAVAKALQSDFKQFSLNNLEWMVLGKVYFKKAEKSTVIAIREMVARELFKSLNIEITDLKEISKWAGRFHRFKVKAKTVCGKMLWLVRDEGLNVHLADAAKMAFGSEYIPKRELPISDRIIEMVTEQDIDKDVMESLIRQDKASITQRKADDRVRKKARKYVGEELQDKKKAKIV